MEHKKIGGWLILIGFQLIVTILISIYVLLQYKDLLKSEDWITLKQLDSTDALAFIRFSYYEIIMNILILLIAPIIIVRFFNMSSLFKDYYSIYMIVIVVLLIIDYLLITKIDNLADAKTNQITRSIFAYIIWGAIWISYLYKGKRPSQTFVN